MLVVWFGTYTVNNWIKLFPSSLRRNWCFIHHYRFSAFWLRSKCSICSYQLNIWCESHVFSSMLIWFLNGDRFSSACIFSIASWLCIAIQQSSAHIPNNIIHLKINHSRITLNCVTLSSYKEMFKFGLSKYGHYNWVDNLIGLYK